MLQSYVFNLLFSLLFNLLTHFMPKLRCLVLKLQNLLFENIN